MENEPILLVLVNDERGNFSVVQAAMVSHSFPDQFDDEHDEITIDPFDVSIPIQSNGNAWPEGKENQRTRICCTRERLVVRSKRF